MCRSKGNPPKSALRFSKGRKVPASSVQPRACLGLGWPSQKVPAELKGPMGAQNEKETWNVLKTHTHHRKNSASSLLSTQIRWANSPLVC